MAYIKMGAAGLRIYRAAGGGGDVLRGVSSASGLPLALKVDLTYASAKYTLSALLPAEPNLIAGKETLFVAAVDLPPNANIRAARARLHVEKAKGSVESEAPATAGNATLGGTKQDFDVNYTQTAGPLPSNVAVRD